MLFCGLRRCTGCFERFALPDIPWAFDPKVEKELHLDAGPAGYIHDIRPPELPPIAQAMGCIIAMIVFSAFLLFPLVPIGFIVTEAIKAEDPNLYYMLIPVLVFDEVDSNIGGETAGVVGKKMKQIGDKRQVLCITHLAPVAAAGHRHYLVSKEIVGGRTLTRLTQLNGEPRVVELTRMLGGGGAAARQHAEALLSIPK